MALIHCTGCGAKVSDRARYCIQCKTPTAQSAHAAAYAPSEYDIASVPKKKRRGILIGSIIGVVVVIAAAVLVSIFYFDGFPFNRLFHDDGTSAAGPPPNQIEENTPVVTPPGDEDVPEDPTEETPPPAQETPSGGAANNQIEAFLEEYRDAIYDMTAVMRGGMGVDGRVEIIPGSGNELIYRFFFGSEFTFEALSDTIAETLENMTPLFEMLAETFREELNLPQMRVTVRYYDYAGSLLTSESFDSAG